jgi:catechol 2,3-dioxygenase-like lactoylglutathione lyase family enzyme
VFERVIVHASDLEASARFYTTVLAVLRLEPSGAPPTWDHFALAPAGAGAPVTRRLHIGFAAPTREHVDAFWQAGTHAGHPDDGAPGPRPEYGPDYYGGFLLDPDGNSVEAVHHDETPHGRRTVDHLWIRVADVPAARRFYAELAPRAGLEIGTDEPERVQLRDATGSFSLVAGTPTEGVTMALRAGDGEERAELTDPDGNRIVLV